MSYIFLDESGDLGFDFAKKRTSRFFVITFLLTREKHHVQRAVKRTFACLLPRERKGHPGILHAVDELAKTRKRLLNELVGQDIAVLLLYLDKRQTYTRLNSEKETLYNFVVNALLDRVLAKRFITLDEPITLVASQRETNRFLNHNFKNFLQTEAARNHNIPLAVEIKTPHQEKGLQAVDFVSWAIFRKLEFGDPTYYEIIKEKIAEEDSLFS